MPARVFRADLQLVLSLDQFGFRTTSIVAVPMYGSLPETMTSMSTIAIIDITVSSLSPALRTMTITTMTPANISMPTMEVAVGFIDRLSEPGVLIGGSDTMTA